jgi:hypothetical protein
VVKIRSQATNVEILIRTVALRNVSVGLVEHLFPIPHVRRRRPAAQMDKIRKLALDIGFFIWTQHYWARCGSICVRKQRKLPAG